MKEIDAEKTSPAVPDTAIQQETPAVQPTEEFPTGKAFLDKWGPRFVNRAREFYTSLVLAIPLNIAFLVYLYFSDTTLLWSIVTGAAVTAISVLFMMVACEFVRAIYVNEQNRLREEARRIREEEQRRREEEAKRKQEAAEAAAKQREAAEAARLAAISQPIPVEEEPTPADETPVDTQAAPVLPELETPVLCDTVLTALSDAGIVLTRTDLLQLLSAMQASRVIRFCGFPYRDLCRTAQALGAAFGNTAVQSGSSYDLPLFERPDLLDDSDAPIKIIPLDAADAAVVRLLQADRDKIRMPFVDEADRKKEFLPDMAQDNWNDCRIWYFVMTPDVYAPVAMDDWSVTVSVLPTVNAAEKTAEPVASAASLQTLSGRAPAQGAGETFFDAVDALDDFLQSSLQVRLSNPMTRTAERFVAAALAAGFTPAESADRFLACVRLPALLRENKSLTQDERSALGEKINALFGYDNVPLSRKLLSEAPVDVQTAPIDNA